MLIIFDLDGTLCNIEHRLHYIQNKPKDWPAFFLACVDDKPVLALVRLAKQLVLAGNAVDVWSGRSDIVRPQTEEWLNRHAIGYRRLRMRRDGDYRPDHIVKAEWLESLPREEWPELVYDDRASVVSMWRAHGVLCCAVAPGEF